MSSAYVVCLIAFNSALFILILLDSFSIFSASLFLFDSRSDLFGLTNERTTRRHRRMRPAGTARRAPSLIRVCKLQKQDMRSRNSVNVNVPRNILLVMVFLIHSRRVQTQNVRRRTADLRIARLEERSRIHIAQIEEAPQDLLLWRIHSPPERQGHLSSPLISNMIRNKLPKTPQ